MVRNAVVYNMKTADCQTTYGEPLHCAQMAEVAVLRHCYCRQCCTEWRDNSLSADVGGVAAAEGMLDVVGNGSL